MKVRVLAKELGVPSEEVMEQLRKLYMEVDDENSEVDDKIVGLIRIKLGGTSTASKARKERKKAEEASAAKSKTRKKPGEKEKTGEKKKAEKKPAGKKRKKEKEETKKEKPEAGEEKPVTLEPKKAPEPEIKKPAIEIVKRAQKPPEPEKKKPWKVEKTKPAIEIVEKIKRPRTGARSSRKKLEEVRLKPEPKPAVARKTPQKLQVQLPVNIRNLAPKINTKPNLIIQYLMGKNVACTINQDLEEEAVRDIMKEFGYELELPETSASIEKELIAEAHEHEVAAGVDEESRSPVVTFMGHVDHGKTSLLDHIRKTRVAKGEKGGITQHIGAYKVDLSRGSVTFLDTPGHAAFTAMRARGAHATDVVVLVVAADDGVMPQTKEAIDHARAADVPIVVAINKCDLPGANPDKVKRELQQEDLAPEGWGGKTIMVEVSAVTGDGIDKLLEMLMLESEMLELKANPKIRARGVVIEGKKTPGQGIMATLLVQNGTLRAGDVVLCGSYYGKVKAMTNDRGQRVKEAPPATPVEVLGLQGVPLAGEEFFVVKDEKKARTLSTLKQSETRKVRIGGTRGVTLEDFHNLVAAGSMKELKIIVKADVQGSVGALTQALEELSTDEVKVGIIHEAVGNINESDAMLAMVSSAIIIGLHVKVDPQAEALAKEENVDIHIYDIIYEAIDEVKAGMEGLLEPEEREVLQGRAQVIEVFSAGKTGKAAGCSVIKGVIHRKDRVRVKRGEEVVHVGDINSLKRFKDDVREVKEGFECGISLKGFNAVRKNDIIEAFIIEKVTRRLTK